MRNKRTIILLLAGFNLILFLVLSLSRPWLPRALAQAKSRPGNYVCVTAKASAQSYDVLYVLDSTDRKLHAFYPANVQTRELSYAGFRDLKADFERP